VTPERIEEVVHHYAVIGGRSPLNELTQRQADALIAQLGRDGVRLPVYVGMRNWHPLLTETLTAMARAGVRRAIGFVGAAHRSYSSCTQYRQNVIDARAEIGAAGFRDVAVTYVDDWHTDEGFIAANHRHVVEALASLPEAARERARIVFTAHSVPTTMEGAARYQLQLHASARLVAERLGRANWALVFQSRSGRPGDPWLEPDVCDYLRAERAKGLEAVVLCPIGFLCDHIEVLYDLDTEARAICEELGVRMVRAGTAGTHPAMIEMIAELVELKPDACAEGCCPPPVRRKV